MSQFRSRILIGLTVLCLGPAFSQTVQRNPVVSAALLHDTSPPLRSLPPVARPVRSEPEPRLLLPRATQTRLANQPDTVLQSTFGASLSAPSTVQNFDGIGNGMPGFTVNAAPPDTNMTVGPNHLVQIVNTDFAVFNKTGALLYGPLPINTLWQNFGGECQADDDGDPVVRYDAIADRFLISQFAVRNITSGYLECIAVSQTSDPTGAYYRYAFSYANFDDYPKIGVWPDGYYTTYNLFNSNNFFIGAQVCAMDRVSMLQGLAANQQCFTVSTNYSGLLPSDLTGSVLPPSGAPNHILALGAFDGQLAFWNFHVNWQNSASSTLTGPTTLTTSPFLLACGDSGATCVPQLGTTQTLDSLGDRLMYRLAYRNFSDHESLVVNHSIAASTSMAPRWYELRLDSSGNPSIFQQGTYAPDASYRWMGSVAMDKYGNMGLGYSVSSATLNPQIRYTGRLSTDPVNTMPQGEITIVSGAGSQTGSSLTRWGDYSSMDVDPVDGCTFWYTTEYIPSNGAFNWKTRMAAFRFPNCVATVETKSAGDGQTVSPGQPFVTALQVLVTDSSSNPVSGAIVTFTAPTSGASGTFAGGVLTTTVTTNASGIATAPVFTANNLTGAYSVTASVNPAVSVGFTLTNHTSQSQPPTADSFSGFVPGNLTQTLTFTYSSPNGFAYLSDVYMIINGSLATPNACSVYYDKAGNGLYLLTNAGTAATGPLTAGSAGTLQNSQCTLNGTGSSVTGSGNSLNMKLNLTFAASFGLAQNIFMYAADAGGLSSGWQNKGTTATNTPPTADSFSGFVGGSFNQSLIFKYSSVNGYGYLGVTYAVLNSSLSGANACMVYYVKPVGLYLVSDSGATVLGPLAPGAAGTLQNSQCTLNGTGSSVTGSGNTLTMTLNLTLTASFGLAQNVYLYAADAGGQVSGWQNKGSTAVSTPPTADSFTGFIPGSLNQTLSFAYSSVNGFNYLNATYALLNSSFSGTGACMVYYVKSSGLYLVNDAGTSVLGPLTPGSANTLQNSQCTLNGTGSAVSGSGNTLTMTLHLNFSAAFGSAQTVFIYAADAGGLVSGWQNKGTTGASTPPTADSFTGFVNGSLNQNLTFTYSSVNGANYLSYVYGLFNSGLSGASSCTFLYEKPTNTLYLFNDAGTGLLGPLAGSNLQNSQCTINAAGTTVSAVGNTLTVVISLKFTAGFGTGHQVYMYAADSGGLVSGWVSKGSTL